MGDRPDSRHCRKCQTDKPVSEFYKDRSKRGGLQFKCKDCDHKAQRSSGKYRRYTLKHDYGMTETDFAEMMSNQSFACAICSTAFTDPFFTHVDHCHVTGRVRGILCRNCNLGIGYLQDSAKLLESAMRYLS